VSTDAFVALSEVSGPPHETIITLFVTPGISRLADVASVHKPKWQIFRGCVSIVLVRVPVDAIFMEWLCRLLGPVDPSFRALSGRLKLTVRRHKLIKNYLLLCRRWSGRGSRRRR